MTIVAALVPHRLAGLIPQMSDVEFAELRDDITANGLKQPIVLFEGEILDGRHRYRACVDAGVEPEFTEYDGDTPASFVLSLNVKRRQLSKSQRAAIAALMLPELEAEAHRRMSTAGERGARSRWNGDGGVQNCTTPSDHRNGRSAEFAAKAVGDVSPRTVHDAKVVLQHAPDLHKRVMEGEMSVEAATQEVRQRREANGVAAKERSIGGTVDGPLEGRRLNIANTAKERIAGVVGTCQAWESALNDIQVELALRVMSTDEINDWRRHIQAARKALAQFDKRLANGAANA